MAAVLVLVTYRARPGAEEQLSGVLRTHVARLRELGFIADKPHFAAARPDQPGTFVESFWWVGPGAIEQAHDHPDVQEIWMRIEDLCAEPVQSIELLPLD